MLKLYALMNRLQGRIVLLVVNLIFLSSCAGLGTTGGDSFYPEYYAAKRLDNKDAVQLRNYMSSPNERVSDSATLILGIDYLRHGNKNFGRALIDKSYNSSSLDNQMKIFGQLWKMESLLSENKVDEATKIKDKLKDRKVTDEYTKTLTIYCISIGEPLLPGENPFTCVEDRFANPEKEVKFARDVDLPQIENQDIVNPNLTYEEYVVSIEGEAPPTTMTKEFDANSEIDIVGGDLLSDFVQGMIFAINNLHSTFTVNAVADEDSIKNAVAVYPDKDIVQIGDIKMSFGVDWDYFIDTVSKIEENAKYKDIVICASQAKQHLAKKLSEKYKAMGSKVRVLDYNNGGFQSNLRYYLDTKKTKKVVDGKEVEESLPVLIIGIGNEEEITDFVAVARFLQSSKEQKILLMMSSFTNISLSSDYKQYFRNIEVVTPLGMVNDTRYFSIKPAFEAYFGKDMGYKNIIGYDAIIYLLNHLNTEKTYDYISVKDGFIDSKAYRNILLYSVDRNLRATEKPYKLIDNNDETNYGIGSE